MSPSRPFIERPVATALLMVAISVPLLALHARATVRGAVAA